MINEQNFLDKPVKDNLQTYDNIQKIATGQVNDYITGCLLDYKKRLLQDDSNRFKL